MYSRFAVYLTRKLKLGRTKQLDRLAGRSGMLWSHVAKWHWRFVRRQGHWPSKKAMQRWLCKGCEGLHSQSSQAVADSFYDASLDGERNARVVTTKDFARRTSRSATSKSSGNPLRFV